MSWSHPISFMLAYKKKKIAKKLALPVGSSTAALALENISGATWFHGVMWVDRNHVTIHNI